MPEQVTLQQAKDAFFKYVIWHSSYEAGASGMVSRVTVSRADALTRFLDQRPEFQQFDTELFRTCTQAEFTFNANRWGQQGTPSLGIG